MQKLESLELIPKSEEQRLITAIKNLERHGDLSSLGTLERLLPDASVTSRYYIQRAIRSVRRRHHLPEAESALHARQPDPSPFAGLQRPDPVFSPVNGNAGYPAPGPTATRADFIRLDLSVGLLRRLERALNSMA